MSVKNEFKTFVLNYQPFKWEVNHEDKRLEIKDKHSFEIGYERFFQVFKILKQIRNKILNPQIIDVGAFPGNMIKMSSEIFPDYENYTAVGLDLSQDFVENVKNYNVNCIDTEIDPNFPDSKNVKEWNTKGNDICYLLDTIEHLVDPIYCLENINKSLKIGGYLVLTTDNIANFFYILKMVLKGSSPNVHPILSSMFYKGNHRPHNKEFSKEELFFLLRYTGFEVENHKYFDRMQGEYKIIDNNIKKNKIKFSFKRILRTIVKNISYSIPHFRNHQMVIEKKTTELDKMDRINPTSSSQEWMDLRLKTIGY